MNKVKVLPIFMMTLVLSAVLYLSGCSQNESLSIYKYKVEENLQDNKATYPYVVHTESSTWYLSKEDIELLGEEEYYTGLKEILHDMEQDFSDARNALAGYILEEIPPVDIYTDFCGKAEISKIAGAYYNERRDFIKLFYGWDMAKQALLHEYVHYLTMHCTENPVAEGFWAEGIAEYISKIVCRNCMLRSTNMGLSDEEALFYKEHGAWDEKEGCIDPKLFYIGTAKQIAEGQIVGMDYFTVSDVTITRTAQIQQKPSADKVSHIEAACIIAYLADTYTQDLIFENWNTDTEGMESAFGEGFEEIYQSWTVWNAKRFEEAGLVSGVWYREVSFTVPDPDFGIILLCFIEGMK